MSVFHASFKIQSDRRPTFHDVTDQVNEALKRVRDQGWYMPGLLTTHNL